MIQRIFFALITFATLLFHFQYSTGQPAPGPGLIVGKITDAVSNTPLEFATISVFRSDSALSTGGITASDGSFSLEVRPGDYYISVQFISYKPQNFDNIIITPKEKQFDLGTISLSPVSEDLEEVTVTAEKSEMIINLDKKIFNVGKDLSNTGKSALDILDNIPSVTVDLDGNVSLRGSDNLQILVDGKPSGLVSSGSTGALRNLQGNMIEHVEVITNPSARYAAEGMAGIINIVLKKNQQKGVNGSFELTAGYPHNYSAGANVNFRREKINYFFNYNIRYNERPGGGNSGQIFTLPDTSYITIRDQDRLRSGWSNRIRGGADFFINKTSTLTAAYLVGFDDQLNTTDLVYNDYLFEEGYTYKDKESVPPGEQIYKTIREDSEEEGQLDMEFSLNYEKKFKKKDHTLSALAQYVKDAEEEKSNINEQFESYLISPYESSTSLSKVQNKETETNLLLKVDYIHPFGNKGNFEAGYRGEFRNIDNPYFVDTLSQFGDWIRLANYSNIFEYIENINSFYIQAGNNYGKFGIQTGLRAEISDVRTYLHETDEKNERFYINFFPTVHTSLQFNPVHSAQLSYSKRIHRPRFWFLNPFYSYTDPRNFRAGNPNLNPEYTHSLELGYLYKKDKLDFYSGIYYRHTNDKMERVNEVNDSTGITVLIPYNLSTGQSFGFEANASVNPVKWWTLSGDFNFYRFKVEGEFNNQSLSSDDYSWSTRLNSKFKLSKNTDLQTIFFYRAPRETTQGSRETFYMLNAAISKDILKGKGTLTLNVRDVLNSMKFRYIIDQETLYSVNEHRRSQRQYTLTFLYRLNQQKRMGKNSGANNENGNSDMGGDDMGF